MISLNLPSNLLNALTRYAHMKYEYTYEYLYLVVTNTLET